MFSNNQARNMEESKETKKVTLKLLVDSAGQRVLFAEASKDFVDFLFYIMVLPVGTIVKLLKVNDMAGCLNDLYKSIEKLRDDYLLEGVNKAAVLSPRPAVTVPLLLISDAPSVKKNFYRCPNSTHCAYASDDPSAICPYCSAKMATMSTYVAPRTSQNVGKSSSKNEGYVRGLMTYMVMDNLEVKAMSTISAMTLLNKFHVKDVSALFEKEVQVGLSEGVAILKASLETRAVLTTVFLGKKVSGSK